MISKNNTSGSTNVIYQMSMKICNDNYILSNKIGQGNFGEVFLGIVNPQSKQADLKQNKQVAVKIQKIKLQKPSQLPNQIQILKNINRNGGQIGFSQIYESGIQKGNNYMVMDILGPNLSQLMKICGGFFSLETTVVLALQMFQRIQHLHNEGYLFQDIKPQNFVMGSGHSSSVLYLIDFGLSRKYRDFQSGLHRPYKQQKSFNGTQRYASICSHLRIQQSRRDDLQSLCYVIIYLMKGTLPWQLNRTQARNQTKQKWITQQKMKINSCKLCQDLPIEFQNILDYCLELEFYEDPDYNYIHSELGEVYQRYIDKSKRNFSYDWTKLPPKTQLQKSQKIILINSNVQNKPQTFVERQSVHDKVVVEVQEDNIDENISDQDFQDGEMLEEVNQ